MESSDTRENRLADQNRLVLSTDQAEHAIALLRSQQEPTARDQAIDVLGRGRCERAVLPLFKLLVKQRGEVKLEARITKALLRIGEPAVLPLIEACQVEGGIVRQKAVRLLGLLGDERGLAALAQALQDDNEAVRCAAVRAASGFPPQQTLPLLIEGLQDRHYAVRSAAAAALAPPQVHDELAFLGLMAAIKDPHHDVRSEVIRTISRYSGDRAVVLLLEAVQDEFPWVRAKALEALGLLHETRAIALHMKALSDPSWDVREHAAAALAGFGDRTALAIALATSAHLPISEKLEALEVLSRLHFKGLKFALDYRFPSVPQLCLTLLEGDPAPEVRQAVQAVQAEIQARLDRQQLLRGSRTGGPDPSEELLRAHSGAGSSTPREMLRASDLPAPEKSPRLPWLAQLRRRLPRMFL